MKLTSKPEGWQFIDDEGTFTIENPHKSSYLYFPLANEEGMMSSITPTLQGDIKTGQNSFLMAPVSAENLHDSRSGRNFWIYIDGIGAWSAAGISPSQIKEAFETDSLETSKLTAGLLWHKLVRKNEGLGIKAEVTSFVPASSDKVELMKVEITNTGAKSVKITPTAVIPIYGRSADNIRDHRHVTSLLNRIYTTKSGVVVRPSLSFDERGHGRNYTSYCVSGFEGNGELPEGFFPVAEEFTGEGGSYEWPLAVVNNLRDLYRTGEEVSGYEAAGAVRFRDRELRSGESASYIVVMQIADNTSEIERIEKLYSNEKNFDEALEHNKLYWREKTEKVLFITGDRTFDGWMRWVAIQPVLRRIFGCSFLPHHDYGRGGRGWRDLWQDCLALIMIDPAHVRNLLFNNFAGVRIDGSNATIIGAKPGEFIADRNNIPRIWMDHGAWPFLTTKLYIDNSGDIEFLNEKQVYFKDRQINRSKEVDLKWHQGMGSLLKDENGSVYEGTILEHILLQNLTPFFNVGEHNNIRLEGADWNDALDMAADKGESVAFTSLYGSNLLELLKLLMALREKTGQEEVEIALEIQVLLDTLDASPNYSSVIYKHEILDKYFSLCSHNISGERVKVSIDKLCIDLKTKGEWIKDHLRDNEWIKNSEGYEWFNGYYDNNSMRIEGDNTNGVRMTLTGQVFSIMGNIATDEQIVKIIKSVNRYLYAERLGGCRLNTNFGEVKLDLGRCFGFAFGTKENGAMFSHMTVMYANALYRRGFAREGFKVLNSIYSHCISFEKSRIYPGIPEYINEKGRGVYSYLTGSASWLLLTMLEEAFGIKGELGDLVIKPKLVREQFDEKREVSVNTEFGGRRLSIKYRNPDNLDYGEYTISEILIDGNRNEEDIKDNKAVISKKLISSLTGGIAHTITIELKKQGSVNN